ncbi:hypothetical protein PFISCL1PPCAC_21888, partial [Pristionchus fissidentatus]
SLSCTFRKFFNRFRYVFSRCEFGKFRITPCTYRNQSLFPELIELCMNIRHMNYLHIYLPSSSSVEGLTDDSLRELLSNKKDVDIELLYIGISATGLFKVWEDLLDGRFDGLSIYVYKSVATDLFDLLRTDGEK